MIQIAVFVYLLFLTFVSCSSEVRRYRRRASSRPAWIREVMRKECAGRVAGTAARYSVLLVLLLLGGFFTK